MSRSSELADQCIDLLDEAYALEDEARRECPNDPTVHPSFWAGADRYRRAVRAWRMAHKARRLEIEEATDAA